MSWLSVGTGFWGSATDGGGGQFKKRCGSGFCGDAIRAQAGFLARRPELMVHGTEDHDYDFGQLMQRASVLVIGPGLGLEPWGEVLLRMSLQAASEEITAGDH